jgi:predicted ferric reductase
MYTLNTTTTFAGAWTSGLHAMVAAVGGQHTITSINLEGPYGYDWLSTARDRLQAGGNVAFIAGNLGIASFASALQHLAQSAPHLLSGVRVLWTVRSEQVLSCYGAVLQVAAAGGADVTVHVTGQQQQSSSNSTASSSSTTPNSSLSSLATELQGTGVPTLAAATAAPAAVSTEKLGSVPRNSSSNKSVRA